MQQLTNFSMPTSNGSLVRAIKWSVCHFVLHSTELLPRQKLCIFRRYFTEQNFRTLYWYL